MGLPQSLGPGRMQGLSGHGRDRLLVALGERLGRRSGRGMSSPEGEEIGFPWAGERIVDVRGIDHDTAGTLDGI
jgi:hypothetical protein